MHAYPRAHGTTCLSPVVCPSPPLWWGTASPAALALAAVSPSVVPLAQSPPPPLPGLDELRLRERNGKARLSCPAPCAPVGRRLCPGAGRCGGRVPSLFLPSPFPPGICQSPREVVCH
eukprot:EG_transcript_19647